MSVSLAPAALDRVRRYLSETPDALGLRFGVKKTGCSGWQYVADLAKESGQGDRIFLQDRPILENQVPRKLPLDPGAEMPVRSDRMSLAYRKYLREKKLRYGVLTTD